MDGPVVVTWEDRERAAGSGEETRCREGEQDSMG